MKRTLLALGLFVFVGLLLLSTVAADPVDDFAVDFKALQTSHARLESRVAILETQAAITPTMTSTPAPTQTATPSPTATPTRTFTPPATLVPTSPTLPSPTQETTLPAPTDECQRVEAGVTALNIREAPSVTAGILGKLAAGDRIIQVLGASEQLPDGRIYYFSGFIRGGQVVWAANSLIDHGKKTYFMRAC